MTAVLVTAVFPLVFMPAVVVAAAAAALPAALSPRVSAFIAMILRVRRRDEQTGGKRRQAEAGGYDKCEYGKGPCPRSYGTRHCQTSLLVGREGMHAPVARTGARVLASDQP
jgi:hypothetical protein